MKLKNIQKGSENEVKINRVSEVRKDMRILKNIRKIEINLKFSAGCSVQNAGCLKIKNEAYR